MFKLLRAFADAFFDRVCRAVFFAVDGDDDEEFFSLFLSLWRLCFKLVVVADLLATNITHASNATRQQHVYVTGETRATMRTRANEARHEQTLQRPQTN